MNTAKPFEISKKLVAQAYRKVKAKAGAAGIDQESIEEFERNLKGNLYRIWNRLSSGSYFSPAVKGVTIPKKSGGTRLLGVPTVSDRVAQTVVKMLLEPMLEPVFDENSLDIDLTNRHMMRLPLQGSDVGSLIGLLNLTLKVYLTISIMTC